MLIASFPVLFLEGINLHFYTDYLITDLLLDMKFWYVYFEYESRNFIHLIF